MKTATVRTLRNDYAKLLRHVETGEQVAITRRGRIVARLVPAHDNPGNEVDWSTSAASEIVNTGQPISASLSGKIRSDSQGNW